MYAGFVYKGEIQGNCCETHNDPTTGYHNSTTKSVSIEFVRYVYGHGGI